MSCNVSTEIRMPQPRPITNIDERLTPHYIWNDSFMDEKERLKTFDNWPLKWLDKNTLAATGMFYTGDGDKTKCYFCEIIIGKWELQDDPVQEHFRWSPHCPLLKRRLTNNVAINEVTLDQLLPPAKAANYDTPPIPTWKKKSYSDYSVKATRLHSFAEWPRSLRQKPEDLAEAGFYYKGVGDSVICFSCLGGLKDWEEEDDPWEQHALWMGHYCPYVKLIKGEEFIRSVAYKFKNSAPKQSEENVEPGRLIGETSTEMDDSKTCKICFDKECNTAYVPCGHVVCCSECAFATKDCPLCRVSVERVVRLYFS